MAQFKVEGGHRLSGEITPQGAKNEALQILCATLLTPEKVVVHNVPDIVDVVQLIELLAAMGVRVERLSQDTYSFCAETIDLDYLRSADYHNRCRRLRGSVMMIGPLLARFGVGYMPKPGGDKIGRRRLDTHFLGFQKLPRTLPVRYTHLPPDASFTTARKQGGLRIISLLSGGETEAQKGFGA